MRRLINIAMLLAVVSLASHATAEIRQDVEYANVDGESLKLDVHMPDGAGPFPIAILVHGGGWSGGDKTNVHVPPTEPFTEAGFTWFSIDYRLAPTHRWPACAEDVERAIRWVKAHAAEYQGDPDRVVLVGYSAGGHLAAYAAVTAADDTRVQAVVLFAAPTDLVADSTRRGGLSPSLQGLFDRGPTIDVEARAGLQSASPIEKLRGDSPPCMMIHGTIDESVDYEQSLNYRARMQSLGVPCELITILGGPHDVKAWTKIDPLYQKHVVDWLLKTLTNAP
jgi:alpha-L-fucosidase 2